MRHEVGKPKALGSDYKKGEIRVGKLIEFKPRQIQPAIDEETFLAMLLSKEKREEVCRKFDQIEYVAEKFHVIGQEIRVYEDQDVDFHE